MPSAAVSQPPLQQKEPLAGRAAPAGAAASPGRKAPGRDCPGPSLTGSGQRGDCHAAPRESRDWGNSTGPGRRGCSPPAAWGPWGAQSAAPTAGLRLPGPRPGRDAPRPGTRPGPGRRGGARALLRPSLVPRAGRGLLQAQSQPAPGPRPGPGVPRLPGLSPASPGRPRPPPGLRGGRARPYLHGVGADDLPAEAQPELQRQRRLAGAGSAQDHDQRPRRRRGPAHAERGRRHGPARPGGCHGDGRADRGRDGAGDGAGATRGEDGAGPWARSPSARRGSWPQPGALPLPPRPGPHPCPLPSPRPRLPSGSPGHPPPPEPPGRPPPGGFLPYGTSFGGAGWG